MEKSRLKPYIAEQLLKKENEKRTFKIAMHFDIALASLKAAITRQAEYLTTPAYEVQIKKALGIPSNVKISEIYTPNEDFLSKHN
jgi:hypothetical protein